MRWFYVITDEMIGWGLSGSELLVFAMVNGYSQMGQGCYWGSLETTASMCGISTKTAARTLQSLIEQGYIIRNKVVIKDTLCTAYYVTRLAKIEAMDNLSTIGQNGYKTMDKMSTNNIIDNINIKRECIKGAASKKFTRPSVAEIQAYCEERNNGINAEDFFNFYESKGWVIGRSPMKDWKAAVRTWESSRRKNTLSDQKKSPAQKLSAVEQNMRLADEMFGTNLTQHTNGTK